MQTDLNQGAIEIFKFKELLKEVITASMNVPTLYLEKIYTIYEQFVDLVDSFNPYTLQDVQEFIDTKLTRYDNMPYFPVLAGLYIDALINHLFRKNDILVLDLDKFCSRVVDDAAKQAAPLSENTEEESEEEEVTFSLDFLGYLLPDNKTLEIKGAVGEYCGAQMGKNAKLIVHGQYGKHFGFMRDDHSQLLLY